MVRDVHVFDAWWDARVSVPCKSFAFSTLVTFAPLVVAFSAFAPLIVAFASSFLSTVWFAISPAECVHLGLLELLLEFLHLVNVLLQCFTFPLLPLVLAVGAWLSIFVHLLFIVVCVQVVALSRAVVVLFVVLLESRLLNFVVAIAVTNCKFHFFVLE